jgi:hypothetical protein
MANPMHHAMLDTKNWGGVMEDYLPIHQWFDQTKAHLADARHRMILHNTFGIFLCEQFFGPVLTLSNGKQIPTRWVAESHVKADFGGLIPSIEMCFASMELQSWMYEGARKLSKCVETGAKTPMREKGEMPSKEVEHVL